MSRRSRAPDGAGRSGRIQAVDRAVDLMRAVAVATPDKATGPALAETCGLNRATAWRMLKTLEAQGMVAQDGVTGRYSIGLTVIEMSGSAGHDALLSVAHPVLERACRQTGETASLAVVSAGGLVYIDEVTPPSVLAASWLGRSVPTHATSTGKALLAYLPAEEQAEARLADLTAYTPTTITSPEALREELRATRERGYGVCRGELEPTLYGVSAPVLDGRGRPVAVLSLWGPSGPVSEERFAELGAVAVGAAGEVSTARLAAWR